MRDLREFDRFIRDAQEENASWLDERDIFQREWAHCMFQFVRRCRFHPELGNLEATQAADVVEDSLSRILMEHSDGDPDDPWAVFENDHSEPSWDAFIDLWHKVRRPIELDDPLGEAARRASEVLQMIPDSARSRAESRQKYIEFVSIAGHLQILLGEDQAIALPVERLAEILGVTRQRVGQMRSNAVRDGLLIEKDEYKPRGKAPGRASTYFFELSLFPSMKS